MEELQDALEDAQYVNAINVNEGPRPITAWEDPSEEVLAEWKEQYIQKWNEHYEKDKRGYHEPFGIIWVLSRPLGLFLFSSYLKEVRDDYLQICFIEEVARWRLLRGPHRGLKLRKIYERYLSPIKVETNEAGETVKLVPKAILIDELDLHYSRNGPTLSEEKLNQLYSNTVNKSSKSCCLGLEGPLLNEVVSVIEEALANVKKDIENSQSVVSNGNDTATTKNDDQDDHTLELSAPESSLEENSESTKRSGSTLSRSTALGRLPENLFDKLEQVVLEAIRKEHWNNFAQKGVREWDKLMNYMWHKDQPVVEDDFFLMRVLGRGGFGLVTACKKGTTGKLYAMKVMNKKRIKAKKSSTLALNELAVLKAVDSPFVVNLKYSFQTKDDLYLILDLMTGGDLSFHLSQKKRFPKNVCLYYAARIILGLQALHDKKYVYRDLKPENLLLSEDGRVRITDLGLATRVTSRLHGAAGTRGYWAPEMLKRNDAGKRMNYDHRIDWFSFGCVLAEMISGVNPFRSEAALKFGQEKEETKEKAIDYATMHMDPQLGDKRFDEDAKDICLRLLDKCPDTRLGNNGCEEIISHPWFNTTNWEKIMNDTEPPPFVPLKDINAASQSEIGVFDEDKNAPKLDEKDTKIFKDWDWTNPKVFSAEVLEMLIYERDTGSPLIPLTAVGTCCCTVM
mmetsp:Transcript_15686/g.19127  ORF Transcript_15686/g.19127 Transcript_15686/m.19127 type:complete len:680 (-) Transcript_15686:1156-3195(-)